MAPQRDRAHAACQAAQVTAVYYGVAVLLHFLLPLLFPLRSVQSGKRRPGQVLQEALTSVGAPAAWGWTPSELPMHQAPSSPIIFPAHVTVPLDHCFPAD